LDDSTPILVGAGQFVEKDVHPFHAHPPMGIAAEAAKAAIADTGVGAAVVSAIDTVMVTRIFPDCFANDRVSNIFGRAQNPPRAVARRIGANPKHAIYGTIGGNTPQKAVNEMAQRISEGDIEVALLTGSEAINTAQKAVRQGIALNWHEEDSGSLEDRGLGERMSTDHELAHGLSSPIFVYPLFENAIRAQLGNTIEQHLLAMGELFEPFSKVAAANPFAFYGTPRSAIELATVTPENRIIGFPYPKWMNAMDSVNQGAALVLTSVGKARQLGINPKKWVFLHGCGEADDKIMVTDRVNYYSSPALKLNSQKAFEMAGSDIDEIQYIDIYSCFPSAVEVACDALGISTNDKRGLTLTGGLPFFGGPGNNYSMHAIAALLPLLRQNPSAKGLISANGGRLTKHATGIYSCEPIVGKWQREAPAAYQSELDKMPSPRFTQTPDGIGIVQTYTVACDRSGPVRAIVVGRLEDGQRFLANTPDDSRFLQDFMNEEQLGRRGVVSSKAGVNLFLPH
jgi:acetyl-CoA C-acetyltransferase